MAKNQFDIDDYIEPGMYSKQYVKSMLKDLHGKPVTVNVSSLGGSVDHALSIHDQFAEHGNITINYTGFNASSATLIAMGAKNVRISENSLFLIHKVMLPVDIWGWLNENDIDEVIEKLEKAKGTTSKTDLMIARIYADRTGKSIKEIHDLMQQDKWITAEEAKEWGFVNEVYKPKAMVNYMEDQQMVAKIAASDLPPIPRQHEQKKDHSGVLDAVKNALTEFFKNSNTEKFMDKFKLVNQILGVDKLNTVDNKATLTEDEVQKIENSVQAANDAKEKAEADLKAANEAKTLAEADLKAAKEAREAAENALANLDELDDTVKNASKPGDKVNAVIAFVNNTADTDTDKTKGDDEDPTQMKIEGADEINQALSEFI